MSRTLQHMNAVHRLILYPKATYAVHVKYVYFWVELQHCFIWYEFFQEGASVTDDCSLLKIVAEARTSILLYVGI